MDYLEIGPNPAEELCVAVGEENYSERARKECETYIEALTKFYGAPPEGAYYSVADNPHDFGTYHEVRINFDPENPIHVDYALKAEHGLATWEEAGMNPDPF